ncbi:MAG: hypothetical protein ACFE0Q_01855 [Anaerolineae bacterium]
MAIPPLKTEKVSAHYDTQTRIAHIKYQGMLSAEETISAYNWLADLIEAVGVDSLYGEIFDFRDVTEFAPDNLMKARSSSRRHNMRNNVRDLPVVMIVSSFYQEEILRGPMQNVEENKRKSIVWKMEEAQAFIDQWHSNLSTEDEQASDSAE